jgi:pyruvate,water dikinase
MRLREIRIVEDVAEAGGKAAGLAALARTGVRIPRTWLLPAAALDEHLARAGATARARELEGSMPSGDQARAAAALRSAIFSAAIDDELSSSVREILASAGALAVRSSATVEGLPGSSLAGQFQSFLGVRDQEQALSAIRSCWASLWSPAAVRSRTAAPGGRPGMALIAQSFVPADVAGTAEVDRDGVMVEAAWGLGPAVLAGLVVPDRWSFDAAGALRAFRAGSKPFRFIAENGGIHAHRVTADFRTTPCLDEARAAKVAALARTASAALGEPLLVEWACRGVEIVAVQATHRAVGADAADGERAGLRGIPAAPGVAVGHVRGPRAAVDPSVRNGTVLVASYIGPSAVASLHAAAIVTEMGGSSAHAVTLARERGVPMVTGVIGARRVLREGDLVRVDGTRGLVQRISDQGA